MALSERQEKAMISKVQKLEARIVLLDNKFRREQRVEDKILKALPSQDKTAKLLAKSLTQLEETTYRVQTLASKLESYINRECVLTEVSRYVRSLGSSDLITEFHLQLMKAYNWGDEFWEQKGSRDWTISEWFKKIMAVEEARPEETNGAIKELM